MKTKKLIRFWESWKGTLIDKGAREQIKRITRIYNKHRGRNKS